MFREMRRTRQQLSQEASEAILHRGSSGVLALLGDGGYPYTVPLNYACIGDKIYFHCAQEGHKIDAIRSCDQASFCVIDADAIDPEAYSTRFRSVIAFGRVRMVEDAELKFRALMAICEKYVPGMSERSAQKTRADIGHTGIIEFAIEHITGKESRALARERRREE